MTDPEIIRWAEMLVDSKLSRSQLIQYLINNSSEDRMSFEDKTTCIRAIKLIKQGVIYDHPPVGVSRPLDSGFPLAERLDGTEQVET